MMPSWRKSPKGPCDHDPRDLGCCHAAGICNAQAGPAQSDLTHPSAQGVVVALASEDLMAKGLAQMRDQVRDDLVARWAADVSRTLSGKGAAQVPGQMELPGMASWELGQTLKSAAESR